MHLLMECTCWLNALVDGMHLLTECTCWWNALVDGMHLLMECTCWRNALGGMHSSVAQTTLGSGSGLSHTRYWQQQAELRQGVDPWSLRRIATAVGMRLLCSKIHPLCYAGIALFPGPRPASRRLQYGKAGAPSCAAIFRPGIVVLQCMRVGEVFFVVYMSSTFA